MSNRVPIEIWLFITRIFYLQTKILTLFLILYSLVFQHQDVINQLRAGDLSLTEAAAWVLIIILANQHANSFQPPVQIKPPHYGTYGSSQSSLDGKCL